MREKQIDREFIGFPCVDEDKIYLKLLKKEYDKKK